DSAQVISDVFKKENCDLILCLGDILYHGPRNDLPNNYCPKDVIKILNPLADKIVAIKGNCEAEVDQMVLDFKINDYIDMNLNGFDAHLEHGHHLDEYNGNPYMILYGHTHIPDKSVKNNILYFNPGSITLPKANSKRSYAIMDNNIINMYDINGKIIDVITLK
nr:phosphodiesterase [Acholeplasmatales bacterium]